MATMCLNCVNLAVNIFSLTLGKNNLAHIFFSRWAARRKYFNSFLDQYSRWKPRKTVIRVWRLSSGVCGGARERVASFFGVTVQFFQKIRPSEERDQDVSLNKETKKRGNGSNTCNIFGKNVKIRKYTFKLF